MCPRQFFRVISQNREYVDSFCSDRNNPFHFACQKWIKNCLFIIIFMFMFIYIPCFRFEMVSVSVNIYH